MQIKTWAFEGKFSKNTIYRFQGNVLINWQYFTVLLSDIIMNRFTKLLTDKEYKNIFIVEDNLFDCSHSKKAGQESIYSYRIFKLLKVVYESAPSFFHK